MSTILFFVLIIVGVVLSLAGGIIGIAQSFSESLVWGLLYLFVPFASLVFLIKFWKQREWVRKAVYASIAGTVAMFLSILVAPQDSGFYAELEAQNANYEAGFEDDYLSVTTESGTSATYSTQPTNGSEFRDAINLATAAANQTQTAKTKEEWSAVAFTWQNSIELLKAVPTNDPNYATAQTKINSYSANLAYAQQNAK